MTKRLYKLPFVFMEDDYWAPKYLQTMGVAYPCRRDDRYSATTGVFEVDTNLTQHLALTVQIDVAVLLSILEL